MMQIIALILLAISLSGMAWVLVGIKDEKKLIEREEIKKFPKIFKFPSLNLQNLQKKLLRRVKIFLLKCENKVDEWLKRISYSKKFQEDYWERLKKKIKEK